jgi:hypothetical protein
VRTNPTHLTEEGALDSIPGAVGERPAEGLLSEEDPAASYPSPHLPAALFDFDEFWDLVDGRGFLIGFQAGAYLQPVNDEVGRGAAVRSGTNTVLAVSLDWAMTLAVERYEGHTSRPGVAGDTPLSSAWMSFKLTRRLAPGTTVSLLQLTGDTAATGFSISHGRAWGPWEGELSFWSSTDTAQMSLATTYTGFGSTLSRAIGRGLRLELRLDAPLVRGQLGSLTLRYTPDDRTDAALALRHWYGTTLLELRGWRRVGRRWHVGACASSLGTFSLCAKRRS